MDTPHCHHQEACRERQEWSLPIPRRFPSGGVCVSGGTAGILQALLQAQQQPQSAQLWQPLVAACCYCLCWWLLLGGFLEEEVLVMQG
jgi:hypothetical protein